MVENRQHQLFQGLRGQPQMRFTTLLLVILGASAAAPSLAQSPNTAALVVFVVDQTGAVVPDARITVLNVGTGAARDARSGADGSTTVAALQISGEYTVTVIGNITRSY